MATTISALLVKLGIDNKEFEKGLKASVRSLNRVGGQLSRIGGSLTRGVSLPLAVAGGAALKASVDFESAFAGVRKTVEATEGSFDILADGLKELSATTLPQSAAELSKVAETAGQLGIGATDILQFTETVSKLGATTNLAAEEAATGLARFVNITGSSVSTAGALGDAIVDLGNNFATTEQEILEFGLRIAGAGDQVGLSQAEILAFGAALSSVGIRAEAGGTAISRVFVEINKAVSQGGRRLEAFAKVAGQTADEFANSFKQDAAGAVTSFIEGLGDLKDSGGDANLVLDELALVSVRVRDALLRSAGAGDLVREAIERSSKAYADGTATAEEYAKRVKTSAFQLQLLRNRAINAAGALGDQLKPSFDVLVQVLQVVASAVGNVVRWIGQLPAILKGAVAGITATVVALGPLAIAMGGLTKAVAALSAVLVTPAGLIAGLAAAVVGLGAAIATATGKTEKQNAALQQLANLSIDERLLKVNAALRAQQFELARVKLRFEELTADVEKYSKMADGRSDGLAGKWAERLRMRLQGARSAMQELQDTVTSLQQEQGNLKLTAVYDTLSESLAKAQRRFNLTKETIGEQQAALNRVKAEIDAYSVAIDQGLSVGTENASNQTALWVAELALAREALERLQMSQAASTEQHGLDAAAVEASIEASRRLVEARRTEQDVLMDGAARLVEWQNELDAATVNTQIGLLAGEKAWIQWGATMSGILESTRIQTAMVKDFMVNSFKQIGDAFGDTVAQVIIDGKSFSQVFKNLMKQFVKQIISSLVSLAAQLLIFLVTKQLFEETAANTTIGLKAAETYGTAFASVWSVVGFPYAIVLAPTVAASAVAALQGGAQASRAATAFAEGGIVTGPTFALIGEAGENEAVLPLSKLDKMLSGGSMGGTNVAVMIDGEVLTNVVLEHLPAEVHLGSGL